MKVLVTGATGTVGSLVVTELQQRGAAVRAFARKPPASGRLPDGVELAPGDLLNPPALEAALHGVDKLFLLNAVSPDELTQGLIAYNLAQRLGIQHVTYLSVYRVDQFADVPHFASKLALEQALRHFGLPFSILRPGYFYENDLRLREPLTAAGLYPMPHGSDGIAAASVADIAAAAALTLTTPGHEGKTYSVVGDNLTGPSCAKIWSEALGKPVRYPGEDLESWERSARHSIPAWMAFDLRIMYQRYLERGFRATPSEREACARLLGRPPGTYAAFARTAASGWKR